jgi:hypothetical protein
VQEVLQALLKLKPEKFQEEAARLWALSNRCFSLWIVAIDSDAGDLPPCIPHLTGLSSLYLQYKEESAAGPRHNDPENKLAKLVTEAADILCILAHATQPASSGRVHWQALFASPGLIDAALTQLAGLAIYLHKQHLANQSSSSAAIASEMKDDRGSSSITGGCQKEPTAVPWRGGSRGTRGSTKRIGSRPARLVGASAFAQLLLNPYHDNIAVAGGEQAIADQAEVVEQQMSTHEQQDWYWADCCASASIHILWAALRISNRAERHADAAPAQSGGAASVAVQERAVFRATGEEKAALLGAAPAARREGLQLLKAVAQLLLEVAALLYSHEEMRLTGPAALLTVLHLTWRLGPEELLSFCEETGALLLEVLWLKRQREHTRQQNARGLQKTLYNVVLRFLSGGLC